MSTYREEGKSRRPAGRPLPAKYAGLKPCPTFSYPHTSADGPLPVVPTPLFFPAPSRFLSLTAIPDLLRDSG